MTKQIELFLNSKNVFCDKFGTFYCCEEAVKEIEPAADQDITLHISNKPKKQKGWKKVVLKYDRYGKWFDVYISGKLIFERRYIYEALEKLFFSDGRRFTIARWVKIEVA